MSTVNIKHSPTKPGPGWVEIDEDKIPQFLKLVNNVKAARKRLDDSANEFGSESSSEHMPKSQTPPDDDPK